MTTINGIVYTILEESHVSTGGQTSLFGGQSTKKRQNKALGCFTDKRVAEEAAYAYVKQTLIPAITKDRKDKKEKHGHYPARTPRHNGIFGGSSKIEMEDDILGMQYLPEVKVTEPSVEVSLRIELTWEDSFITITVNRNTISDGVWQTADQPHPPVGLPRIHAATTSSFGRGPVNGGFGSSSGLFWQQTATPRTGFSFGRAQTATPAAAPSVSGSGGFSFGTKTANNTDGNFTTGAPERDPSGPFFGGFQYK